MPPEVMGTIAAILTTSCFIPQAWKIIRTRDTAAISLWMYLLFTAGVSCWLAYGILLEELPIIIANLVTLPLAITILYYKVRS